MTFNGTVAYLQVVWEDVICDAEGNVKPGWVACFEKHNTRFSIGSDQVGQFIGPAGNNWLRPEIEKYWKLADVRPTLCCDLFSSTAGSHPPVPFSPATPLPTVTDMVKHTSRPRH